MRINRIILETNTPLTTYLYLTSKHLILSWGFFLIVVVHKFPITLCFHCFERIKSELTQLMPGTLAINMFPYTSHQLGEWILFLSEEGYFSRVISCILWIGISVVNEFLHKIHSGHCLADHPRKAKEGVENFKIFW